MSNISKTVADTSMEAPYETDPGLSISTIDFELS